MPEVGNAELQMVDPNTGFIGEASYEDQEAIAKFLSSGGDVTKMRSLSVLREDDWRRFDDTVVQVARDRFTMVADLQSRGLVYPLDNPLAITQLSWDRVSDMDDAQIDMAMESPQRDDRVDFLQDSMPIPLIHKGFTINQRTLLSSRQSNTPLDTVQAAVATRKVVERIEKLFIDGQYDTGNPAGSIYGVTTHPQRNDYDMAKSWTGPSAATPEEIVADVLGMISVSEGDNMFGPWGLYVPKAYKQRLREDYAGSGDTDVRTIEQRILQIEGLQYIRSNQFLTGDNIVLVQLTPEVIDVIDGIQPTLVEWQTLGNMISHYKVMAIILPRIRRDYDNRSGIVHGRPIT